jgi:putative Mg2+ transporter-C (MgtC) family protein
MTDDLAGAARALAYLLAAAGLGGLLGYERQRHGKAAGLRTYMLVSLGAALFVMVPLAAGASAGEVTRVVQGIATGIGFLGAGVILKTEHGEVRGLTTAAGIWMTAALGMAAGAGRLWLAVMGALLALVILALLREIENRITPSGPGDHP